MAAVLYRRIVFKKDLAFLPSNVQGSCFHGTKWCWKSKETARQYTDSVLDDAVSTRNRRMAAVSSWQVDGRLKELSERGSKFSIEASNCIGQPMPYSHPHLLEGEELTPGITKKEYRDRRHQLLSLLKTTHFGGTHDKHVVIIPGAPTTYMSNDVPYPFRQNTEFLYLTGFQEPDAVLVLESVEGQSLPAYRSILFVRPRDPKRELWDGPRAGTQGALLYFGVDEAYPVNQLAKKLMGRYNNKDYCVWYDHLQPVHPTIHREISEVLFNNEKFTYKNLLVLGHKLQMLRVIKSKAEIELMRKSGSIAAQAITKVMRGTRPGLEEAHLHTVLEYECRLQGAERLAYPPVVASGNRANVLHYINNTQIIRNGDLVLMDGGCEYHGYASDVTRTWPVNGTFTKPQRELYDLVLRVQKKCISLCQKDVSLDYLHHFMLVALGQELSQLGLIEPNLTESRLKMAASEFCPHHVGHYLGLDTHDTSVVSKGLGLQPGMVVTVEPGLYVPREADKFPERYRGIGIRIEDDVLITDGAPEVLTAECPKEPDEIQELMTSSSQ